MPYQNPFLRGMLGSQQQAQQQQLGQLQAMGMLSSLQDRAEMAPIQRELAQLQLERARLGPQPKWQVSERFNNATGQKEKVLVDLNNPANVVPFGGQESRPLSFQNTGAAIQGLDPMTGQPRGASIPLAVSPNTAATLGQARDFRGSLSANEAANLGLRADEHFYNTGRTPLGPMGAGPAIPAAPPAGPRTPTPADFPRVSPQEQAQRDQVAGRIRTAELQPDGGGMIPSSRVLPQAAPQTFVAPGTQMGAQPSPQQPAPIPLSPKAAAERQSKQPERVQSLRKEFNDLPEVKNYRTVLPIIESGRNAPDTPAGDLDLIYAVGKILDPNSVVREGELNLVIKSGSPLQKLQGQVNYIMGGRGRLAPAQRQELIQTLESRVGNLESGYRNAESLYRRSAEAEGLPLDQIIAPIQPSRRASDKSTNPSIDALLKKYGG